MQEKVASHCLPLELANVELPRTVDRLEGTKKASYYSLEMVKYQYLFHIEDTEYGQT